MPPIANSAGTSDETLQAALSLLTKQKRRWCKTGSKRYLTTVFNFYSEWKNVGDARSVANRIARLAGSSVQPDRHPIRTIIDATSSADRKSKSRWTQALRYAWRQRSKWQDLTMCLQANGGIAGCADKWADIQAEKRTPVGFVRIGGEDRFLKIPFFVGIELLDQHGDWR
ncbi:MAG: hypothetical protein NTV56_00870 [Alphaproteobacteria bacterium]|nr:hypothetical protein [Alphaproteobacteria bacterium]